MSHNREEAEAATTTPSIPPAALLRRLHWQVLQPLARRLGGDEQSLVRSPGRELHDIREYEAGDDTRLIDWNTTARNDRPFVRVSQVERALDAWLLVDVSASTDWGTAECLKKDRALEIAALAGQLLGRNGNRIGAMLFAERPVTVVPPKVGRLQLLALLDRCRSEPRRLGSGPTDLGAALSTAGGLIRRRSLILIVSDFLVRDGWQAVLGQMARRHEIVAIRIRDPREERIPNVGIVALEDPETGAQLEIDTTDGKLREDFASAAHAQSVQLSKDLTDRGVDQLTIRTDEDVLPALIRFLQSRSARARARR